jgi:hypothetical protein
MKSRGLNLSPFWNPSITRLRWNWWQFSAMHDLYGCTPLSTMPSWDSDHELSTCSSDPPVNEASIPPQFPPPSQPPYLSRPQKNGRRSGQPANALLCVRNVTGQTCMVFNADRDGRRLLQFPLSSPWIPCLCLCVCVCAHAGGIVASCHAYQKCAVCIAN